MIFITKRSEYFFIIIFAAIIITLSSILIISPVKTFSEKENRALSGAPSFSIRSFTDGGFLTELSDFCADQFPLRDYLTDIKAKCEIMLGKRENNGVCITESILVDVCEYKDLNTLEQNLAALERFGATLKDQKTLLCAPRSVDVNSSLLGIDNSFSKGEIYSKINECDVNSVDILSPLIHAQSRSQKIWYATDHHWTTNGAYIAYCELLKSWDIKPYASEFFDIDSVSHSFLGTTYSKSGVSEYTPDSIYLYKYDDGDFKLEYISENRVQNGFYDISKLTCKDKYSVFLGGNYPRIIISKESESRPKLLLIKDSFANSVIPFLALHFDIDVIDPRYISEPLASKVNASDYDRILILCGADTLVNDAGFGKWLGK